MRVHWSQLRRLLLLHAFSTGVRSTPSGNFSGPGVEGGASNTLSTGRVMVLRREPGCLPAGLWIGPSSPISTGNTQTSQPFVRVVQGGPSVPPIRFPTLRLVQILTRNPSWLLLVDLLPLRRMRPWSRTALKSSDPPLAPPPPRPARWCFLGLLGPSLKGGVLS